MTRIRTSATLALLATAPVALADDPTLDAMAMAAEDYASARVAGRMEEVIARFPPRVVRHLQKEGDGPGLLDVAHMQRWGPKDFFFEINVEGAQLQTAGDLFYAVLPSVSRVCVAPFVVQEAESPLLMLFEDGEWHVARLGPSTLTTLVQAQYDELSGLPYRVIEVVTRGPTPEERPSCR